MGNEAISPREINFDRTLIGPDGRPLREPKRGDDGLPIFEEGGRAVVLQDVTLGALCYAVLVNNDGNKLDYKKSFELARLAAKVASGKACLTAAETTTILERMRGQSPAVVFAAVRELDPAAFDA